MGSQWDCRDLAPGSEDPGDLYRNCLYHRLSDQYLFIQPARGGLDDHSDGSHGLLLPLSDLGITHSKLSDVEARLTKGMTMIVGASVEWIPCILMGSCCKKGHRQEWLIYKQSPRT